MVLEGFIINGFFTGGIILLELEGLAIPRNRFGNSWASRPLVGNLHMALKWLRSESAKRGNYNNNNNDNNTSA